MTRFKKWMILIVSGALVAAITLGALAFTNISNARAAVTVSSNHLGGLDFPGGPELPGIGRNHQQYLADALGITLEELQAAQVKAYQAELDQAVKDELLTQKQADLMIARLKLGATIDRQALMAEALGMSASDLQAALDEGKTLRDLMDEKGLDAAALRDAYQAAYEKAVQAAVSDGVITQDQADQVLSGERVFFDFPGGFGIPDGFGRGERPFRFQGPGGRWNLDPSTPPDTSTPSTPSGEPSGSGL